jgi:hypothetical protein
MAIEDRLEELFMSDANNRRVAEVNVPRRPRPLRGVLTFAGVAAIAGIALVATILGLRGGQQAASPTATATAIPSATASTAPTPTPTPIGGLTPVPFATYQSPLGYSVQVPSTYRRSDLRSRLTPSPQGDPNLLAYEIFTAQTPADEAEAMRLGGTGVGPALIYTASVSLYRNSRNETATAYAEREKGSLGLNVVAIEPTTVDGHAAAKTTFRFYQADSKTFYALYVRDGDRIWLVRYFLAQPTDPVPAGATDEGVRSIVESFKFAG